VTIGYTALNSFDYGQQVIQSLSSRVSQNQGFSFRFHLPDPWYDLHNPDQTATPMTVRFRTRRSDFPPNIERLRIQHVALYFARSKDATFEMPAVLRFKDDESNGFVGGAAKTKDGLANKVKKHYADVGKLNLLVYANFQAYLLQHDSVLTAALPHVQTFASVWVVASTFCGSIHTANDLGRTDGWGEIFTLAEYDEDRAG